MNSIRNIEFIFENFYKITHARLSLYDTEFNEVLAYPRQLSPFCNTIQKKRSARQKCLSCDREAFKTVRSTGRTYTYTCHCGLTEVVAPIYHFGILSGFLMMGQVTDTQYRSKQHVRDCAARFFDGGEALSAAVLQIPEIPADLLNAEINLLTVISEFLTQVNFVSSHSEQRPQNIRNYIDAHFTEHLSIDAIAGELECSRATVMNCFKAAYGITVNNYVIEKRLELAADLLKNSDDSIKAVGLCCGFHDQNYFSRVFMRKYHKMPTEYRARQKEMEEQK